MPEKKQQGTGRGARTLSSATKLVETVKRAYESLSPSSKNDLQALLDFPGSPDPTDLLKLGMVLTPKTIGKFQSLYKNILRSYLENPNIPSNFPVKSLALLKTRYPSWVNTFEYLKGKYKITPNTSVSQYTPRNFGINPPTIDYGLRSEIPDIEALAHELMHFNQFDRPGFSRKFYRKYGEYPFQETKNLGQELARRVRSDLSLNAKDAIINEINSLYWRLPYEREAYQAQKTAGKIIPKFLELGGIF